MLHLSSKEIDILRFIRRSRHKTTIKEIADGLSLPAGEVETFVAAMVNLKLINTARGVTGGDDSYYTNPERREEIYELLD
jgi:DNA-binding IclR family transcriptional regulator